MKISELHNKKIGIVGYGIEGESVARFLRKRDIEFSVLDRTPNLFSVEGAVECVFGNQYLDNLGRFDLLIRAPGVRPFLPELLEFQKNGGIIETQTRLFFDNYPDRKKIIGVTGTKGKGTTCILLNEIFKANGEESLIGGNIGKGVFDLLDETSENSDPWIILELSSFQLQDLEASPHIAVVLMVTSDHLDYHRSIEEYAQAKSSIAKYQTANDFIIINADYPSSVKIAENSAAKKYYFSTADHINNSANNSANNLAAYASKEEDAIYFVRDDDKVLLGKISELQLKGYHNTQNICAAALAASAASVPDAIIWSAAKEFSGYEHRLQFVAEHSDIKFYDDSSGTNTASTLTAVDVFDQPTILLVGGFSKGQDYKALGFELAQKGKAKLKAIILLGNISNEISQGLKEGNYEGQIIHITDQTSNAYDLAFQEIHKIAEPGDIVLLAPGTSSFDMFKNYKERGEYFSALANRF
jgi:UDP-N-acetylmuramoylalanine--D-glutamate ligase